MLSTPKFLSDSRGPDKPDLPSPLRAKIPTFSSVHLAREKARNSDVDFEANKRLT